MVTLFYQTAIDYVYFYKIEFAKLIIRYPDVNSIMRDMMSIILEGALDQEMDEELGYSKYDYRNKETDNSRNGHSQKTMHTSYGDMEIDIPRDRKGEFEPQIVKKYQNTVTQDMEEKNHLHVCQRNDYE